MAEKFDLVVLGGGPGGYVAALRAAALGLKTALCDRAGRPGGTCLNVGCIPTKALCRSTELFALAAKGLAEHGIRVSEVSVDLEQLQARKEQVVRALTDGVHRLLRRRKVAFFWAEGRLAGPGKVRFEPPPALPHGWLAPEGVEPLAEPIEVEAGHVVLALGSRPVELPGLAFDGERILDSSHALSLREVPARLLVVGGGAVGLELASIWHRLGSEVTVVEMLPRIAPFADRMASVGLAKALEAQGIRILTGHRVESAEVGRGRVRVTCAAGDGTAEALEVDRVLVAVGRRPNSDGLAELGLELDERGRVVTDGRLRTNLPGVYAVGDLIHGPMLAHKAEEDALAAVADMVGEPVELRRDLIPSVVYTEPELAQVGATEQDLKAQGRRFKAGRFYFAANGRALASGEAEGFVKVLADPETDRILGVSILGPDASELVAQATIAMANGVGARQLGEVVFAHPTLSEAVKEAALAVHRLAIHG